MDNEDLQSREDLRLILLLRAAHAEVDPALWTRVRTRLEARRRMPRLLAWAVRPVALGASLALLAISAVASAVLIAGESQDGSALVGAALGENAESSSLADALLAESGTGGASPAAAARAEERGRDSGSVR